MNRSVTRGLDYVTPPNVLIASGINIGSFLFMSTIVEINNGVFYKLKLIKFQAKFAVELDNWSAFMIVYHVRSR